MGAPSSCVTIICINFRRTTYGGFSTLFQPVVGKNEHHAMAAAAGNGPLTPHIDVKIALSCVESIGYDTPSK